MKTWAKLDGEHITAIANASRAPVGEWTEIPAGIWPGWEARPSPAHHAIWRSGSVQWLDPRSLSEVRAAKRAQIDAWRLQANASGFVYQGKRVATDALSMLDITNTGLRIAATQAMPPDWPGGWKAEGSFIPIATVAQWNAFFDAMYQQGLANFNRSQALKAQVDSASTVAAVEAVTWE